MSFQGWVAFGPDTEAHEGAPCFLLVFLGLVSSAPSPSTGGCWVGWNTGRCPPPTAAWVHADHDGSSPSPALLPSCFPPAWQCPPPPGLAVN